MAGIGDGLGRAGNSFTLIVCKAFEWDYIYLSLFKTNFKRSRIVVAMCVSSTISSRCYSANYTSPVNWAIWSSFSLWIRFWVIIKWKLSSSVFSQVSYSNHSFISLRTVPISFISCNWAHRSDLSLISSSNLEICSSFLLSWRSLYFT